MNETEQVLSEDIVEDRDFQREFEELSVRMAEHIAEHERTLNELEAVKHERDEWMSKASKFASDLEKAHTAILHSGKEIKKSRYEEMKEDLI